VKLPDIYPLQNKLFGCTGQVIAALSCSIAAGRNIGQWRTKDFFLGGGGSTNSVEDRGQRERGSGGGSPLVRGSGGSCYLVQKMSFHIVKFS